MEDRLKSGARRFCQGAFSFPWLAPRAKSAYLCRSLTRQQHYLFFVEAAIFLDATAELRPAAQNLGSRTQSACRYAE
jgi:hypothetical protein